MAVKDWGQAWIGRNPASGAVEVYLGERTRGGEKLYIHSFTGDPREPESTAKVPARYEVSSLERCRPTFTLTAEQATSLYVHLHDLFEPEGPALPGEVGALQAHLADMRRIAFKLLEEEPCQ